MTKYIIEVECEDWLDEYRDVEPTIESDDDIIQLIKSGMDTGTVARLVAVARNEGHAPENILSPNHILYYTGTRAEIAQKVATQREEVTLDNGKTYTVRTFIGKPGRHADDEDDSSDKMDEKYVAALSELGCKRATDYLLNVVPGHIFNRLSQLAANNRDINEVADQLKDKIDNMVAALA